MSSSRNILFGTTFLALSSLIFFVGSCVDPAKGFKDFDDRVIDAGETAIGSGCKIGEIPEVNGEFFLRLSTPLATDAHLKFIATTSINKAVNPAVLSMTLQPLCVQAACTLGQPLGASFKVDDTTVDAECNFTVEIKGMPVEGGANPISGSDLIGNLEMRGNLQDMDFYCGAVDGEAVVAGPVSIDNSTFAATRVPDGTVGSALPDSPAKCPEPSSAIDAGLPDAAVDAMPLDAAMPDAIPLDAAI